MCLFLVGYLFIYGSFFSFFLFLSSLFHFLVCYKRELSCITQVYKRQTVYTMQNKCSGKLGPCHTKPRVHEMCPFNFSFLRSSSEHDSVHRPYGLVHWAVESGPVGRHQRDVRMCIMLRGKVSIGKKGCRRVINLE